MNNIKYKKMILTGIFACLGYVLSTFVYFPAMAPFQHFVNVLAAVFIGPWYGTAAALLTGILRMLSGRSILAVIGAVFGAFLSGVLYTRTQNLVAAVVGEIIGTGIISAIVAYPFMKYLYGLDLNTPFYYIPFFIPSAVMGAGLAVLVLLSLKKSGVLKKLMNMLKS